MNNKQKLKRLQKTHQPGKKHINYHSIYNSNKIMHFVAFSTAMTVGLCFIWPTAAWRQHFDRWRRGWMSGYSGFLWVSRIFRVLQGMGEGSWWFFLAVMVTLSSTFLCHCTAWKPHTYALSQDFVRRTSWGPSESDWLCCLNQWCLLSRSDPPLFGHKSVTFSPPRPWSSSWMTIVFSPEVCKGVELWAQEILIFFLHEYY